MYLSDIARHCKTSSGNVIHSIVGYKDEFSKPYSLQALNLVEEIEDANSKLRIFRITERGMEIATKIKFQIL